MDQASLCLPARISHERPGMVFRKEGHGDIHHIVPKNYLINNGFPKQGDYNQVANFALTETPINIAIKDHPPMEYMGWVSDQIRSGEFRIGEIMD